MNHLFRAFIPIYGQYVGPMDLACKIKALARQMQRTGGPLQVFGDSRCIVTDRNRKVQGLEGAIGNPSASREERMRETGPPEEVTLDKVCIHHTIGCFTESHRDYCLTDARSVARVLVSSPPP